MKASGGAIRRDSEGEGGASALVSATALTAAAATAAGNDPKSGAMGGQQSKHEKERKIGHRRVGEGGEITYKKIQTSQIMGSIQLGIQHTVSEESVTQYLDAKDSILFSLSISFAGGKFGIETEA